ncbi:glycosyltransferase [Paeniglutamicibacter terrestris]|uniref:D-inositol 3-phosphate glycosyltransferase n=1 Tax=Paeniglutamicibacter terrestris TaxID=2723403 RepID=A0ABX1G8K5_9MICC|nr:glycosyltransferase [Paeniglutamicibacter terrestris]ASN39464.1 D-inositol-3-phosphate glycosyltransferase [Arthrobacter sp. 7749]NKG21911.1 glycosyltransferase [Paeniglutamicibacter terrestris]
MSESSALPQRIAMISLHTSPLEQPGSGDAGGMNVYIRHLALALAARGVHVDIFVRGASTSTATSIGDGVTCHEVQAGPLGKLSKEHLAEHLPAVALAIQHYAANFAPYDVIHSHYWLSGVVGLKLSEAWNVPLVHTMHTMGKVKKLTADTEESSARIRGEMLICAEAERLTANTPAEIQELVELYGAELHNVDIVEPGVDLATFHPGVCAARQAVPNSLRVVFAGRIQKLKGPQILVRALGILSREREELDVKLSVIGARSGSKELNLQKLVEAEGVEHLVRFSLPMPAAHLAKAFRGADVVAVPSYSESFGLVALEAQACGTPVLARRVGGLPHAVREGQTGILVDEADPITWAKALALLATDEPLRTMLGRNAAEFAADHGWEKTAAAAINSYVRAIEGT